MIADNHLKSFNSMLNQSLSKHLKNRAQPPLRHKTNDSLQQIKKAIVV